MRAAWRRRSRWKTATRCYACAPDISKRVRAPSSRSASPTSKIAHKRKAALMRMHQRGYFQANRFRKLAQRDFGSGLGRKARNQELVGVVAPDPNLDSLAWLMRGNRALQLARVGDHFAVEPADY